MSTRRIKRAELATLLDIDEEFVAELVAHEIVVCDEAECFDVVAVERVRVCWSMRGFGVNMAGLEVALDLLERWQDERRRVRELLAQLPEHPSKRPGGGKTR